MEDPAWRGAGRGFSARIWHHEALSQADLCPHAEEKAPAISCEPKPLPGQAYKTSAIVLQAPGRLPLLLLFVNEDHSLKIS